MAHQPTSFQIRASTSSPDSGQWASLCQLLNIKANLSTAYHPNTDSQTEWVNQILEQYLRIFINYQQGDWTLQMVENDRTSSMELLVAGNGTLHRQVCEGLQPL